MTQNPHPIQSNASRIASLIRAGVLKTSELSTLKMAMINHAKVGNDVARLPRNQRVVLDKYHSAVTAAATASALAFNAVRKNINAGFELSRDEFISEAISKDPPMVLVLKRKGVRIFADGKRVALYTNADLGVTISVPYDTSAGVQQPVAGVVESVILENINVIKSVADHGEPQVIKFENGSQRKISKEVAKHIMVVHDALNDNNKKLVADMVKRSPEHLDKVLTFAQNNTKYVVGK